MERKFEALSSELEEIEEIQKLKLKKRNVRLSVAYAIKFSYLSLVCIKSLRFLESSGSLQNKFSDPSDSNNSLFPFSP